ncbi:hypothetical protein V6N12_050483 [Hibiscus sabdariffa]|uniref:Polygalacturonase n=1 Tax=Hibiscus sabdariffa TaxID=183260 RepID=A0ABR2GD38_9ROSI
MGGHITQLVIITIFSLFSRYSSLEEGPPPPYNYFEDVVSAGYDPLAYPSYLSTLQDGNSKDFISHTTQLLTLQRLGLTSPSTITLIVDHFGATGDAANDTQAFEKAWEEACSSKGEVILEVPQGKCYHLKPIRFSGPCNSNLTVQIYGSMEASDDMSDYKEDRRHWLIFDRVDNLLIKGGGNINGNGKIWWQNSCKINKHLALTFYRSKNLMVQNLKIQDAQQIHVSFEKCSNVEASALTVTAPETSPNTDGIHVTRTQNIRITDSIIGTEMGSGSRHGRQVTCIQDPVITLMAITYNFYINGHQGGSGSASNIIFQNIEMFNVSNPIIIDQNYCDQDKPCKEQSSAVEVKTVVYKNIIGTSASQVAIKFDCSKTHPCQGILLQNVSLQEQGDTTAKAICNNVKLSEEGIVFPQCS